MQYGFEEFNWVPIIPIERSLLDSLWNKLQSNKLNDFYLQSSKLNYPAQRQDNLKFGAEIIIYIII